MSLCPLNLHYISPGGIFAHFPLLIANQIAVGRSSKYAGNITSSGINWSCLQLYSFLLLLPHFCTRLSISFFYTLLSISLGIWIHLETVRKRCGDSEYMAILSLFHNMLICYTRTLAATQIIKILVATVLDYLTKIFIVLSKGNQFLKI